VVRYIYYQGKVLLSYLLFLPVLVMGGSITVLLMEQANADVRPRYVLFLVEVCLPLLAMLLLNNIILKEKSDGTLELVASKTFLPRLFLQRFSLILLYLGLIVVVFLLILDSYYTSLALPELLLVAAAPSLFLSALGTLLTHLTRETSVGYIAATTWWMFCLLDKALAEHPWAKYVFLFSRTFSSGNGEWVQSKIVLLLLSIFLLAANYFTLRNTERFVR
jgi:hypothetical protein